MRRLVVAAVLAVVAPALVACSDDDEPTPAEPSLSSTPTVSESPTASESVVVEPDPGVKRLVVPAVVASMPDTWRERFVIPYGAGKALLGTSPGGASGSLDIGPEYGAPAPDGTWWFLDYAKGRLAHFDADGGFLEAVRPTKDLLVGGVYFQWSLPHVLADGTLVAVRQSNDGPHMLSLRDGVLDEIAVGTELFSTTYDDGSLLYGFDQDNQLVTVDPADGAVEPTDVLVTPAGTPFTFRIAFDSGKLVVRLPEIGVSKRLPLESASGATAHVGIQVRAGADDTLHLFLVGAGEDDESLQLAGYSSVSTTGAVAPVDPVSNPFSETDPGSPAQLVMAAGSSTPMLVYVLPDGVHVFERVGA